MSEDTNTEVYRTAVETFQERGTVDTEPPGTPTGPAGEWIYSFSEDRVPVHPNTPRSYERADRARFEFWRVADTGYRYDGYVVVSFLNDTREETEGVVVRPDVYARWYTVKPPEKRTCEADVKEIDQQWVTNEDNTAFAVSVDELVELFEEGTQWLLKYAEVCNSDRRQEIARAAEHYWNDTPETETTSLTDF